MKAQKPSKPGRRLTLTDLRKPAAASSFKAPRDALKSSDRPAAPTIQPKSKSKQQRAVKNAAKRQAIYETPGAVEALQTFRKRWPEAFRQPRRPLAIGIHRAIIAELGEDHAAAVAGALMRWTRATAYLLAVSRGEPRIGLDGAPAGTVTEPERAHAADMLRRRAARAGMSKAA